jgi:putative aldouronate transport system permease protein
MKTFNKSFNITLLALPGIVLIFIFNYVPLYGLLLPFKNYRFDLGIWNSPWVGLDNFQFLFNGNAIQRALRNTILYNLVFISLGTFVSVVMALMLREISRKFVRVYQTVLFIPYFISWVVAGFAFRALFDMDYGVVNKGLAMLGETPIMWYNEPKYWPFILVIVSIWKGLGYGAVIYYAALMGVDAEYYEAAKIDGAGKLRQALSISIPMIKPIIFILVILQIGRIFYSDFGLFFNVTLNSSQLYPTTDVIDTFVYRSLIDLGDIGMASAAGFFQSTVGFILVLLTNYMAKKFNPENSLF